MALNPKDKVYLSETQLQTLAEAGIIANGTDTYSGDEDTMYLTSDTSVLYEEQALTTAQKTQARTNIGAEDVSNKVTSVSSASTDSQYPTAKCLYDIVGDIETLLGGI